MQDIVEPETIGHFHAGAPVVKVTASYAENVSSVVVDVSTYDHVRVASLHLDVGTADALANQLADAVLDAGLADALARRTTLAGLGEVIAKEAGQ